VVEKSDEWGDNHHDRLDELENLARPQFAGARLHGAADFGSVCHWTNVTGVLSGFEVMLVCLEGRR